MNVVKDEDETSKTVTVNRINSLPNHYKSSKKI